ncbi:hypothetical protein Tco_0910503 [Tanacetum coccineum]|uniref:Uncharacterized protein n=1 Tax=Tanacetum coccineum TaxID=301880 RepID=A0ABQ5CVB7_9ASTR
MLDSTKIYQRTFPISLDHEPSLEKNILSFFREDCILAFQTLKKKVDEAPILIAFQLGPTFEIMWMQVIMHIGIAVSRTRIEKLFDHFITLARQCLKQKRITQQHERKGSACVKDAKDDCCDGLTLLQEFDFKVYQDTKGDENYAVTQPLSSENLTKIILSKEITETFPLGL